MPVNMAAPIHIMTVLSGGNTTPRPIPTADNGKRPLRAMRIISSTNASNTPASMAHAADTGSTPHNFAIPSGPVCTTLAMVLLLPMPSITLLMAAH